MNSSIKSSSALKPLFRSWPLVVFAMMSGVFIAKKYIKYATPKYESTAKIKLADIHEGITDSKLYKDFDVFVSSNKLGAEVELLKSKVLIRKAIKDLPLRITIYRIGKIRKSELYVQTPFTVSAEFKDPKLYDLPFTVKVYKDSLVELKSDSTPTIKSSFNHLINIKGGRMIIYRNDQFIKDKPGVKINDNYQFVVHSENKLLDGIVDDLDVMSVDKDIAVLRISYKSAVPQESADVVNSLAKAYINDYIEERSKSADTTEKFLNQQLDTYGKNLSSSENDIQDYRDKNNIINTEQETETDLRKIADLKKQLANVKMNLNAADSLNKYISTGKDHFLKLAPNFEEFTDLLSTEMVKQIQDLQRAKEDLLLKYTPENEKVKVIDHKLQDIFNYLQESIRNSQSSLRIKYNDLQQSIDDAQKVFIGLPGKEKNMTILGRNYGLNDEVYRFLHEKRTEAQIAKAASISFHRIISEGEVPKEPVSPNKIIITILMAILGMFAGIAMIYIVHNLKGRVNNEDIINRLSDIPIAASVPNIEKVKDKMRFFRGWVLQLELLDELKNGAVITVSSFNKREGKSFITAALEQEAAMLDKNILFIDAEKTVTGELSKPLQWKKYIVEQKSLYDMILVKNFALNDNPAGMVLMTTADLNLFVLDSRRTKKACIPDADLLKEELRIPNMQFVLNRAGFTPNLFSHAKVLVQWLLKKIKK